MKYTILLLLINIFFACNTSGNIKIKNLRNKPSLPNSYKSLNSKITNKMNSKDYEQKIKKCRVCLKDFPKTENECTICKNYKENFDSEFKSKDKKILCRDLDCNNVYSSKEKKCPECQFKTEDTIRLNYLFNKIQQKENPINHLVILYKKFTDHFIALFDSDKEEFVTLPGLIDNFEVYDNFIKEANISLNKLRIIEEQKEIFFEMKETINDYENYQKKMAELRLYTEELALKIKKQKSIESNPKDIVLKNECKNNASLINNQVHTSKTEMNKATAYHNGKLHYFDNDHYTESEEEENLCPLCKKNLIDPLIGTCLTCLCKDDKIDQEVVIKKEICPICGLKNKNFDEIVCSNCKAINDKAIIEKCNKCGFKINSERHKLCKMQQRNICSFCFSEHNTIDTTFCPICGQEEKMEEGIEEDEEKKLKNHINNALIGKKITNSHVQCKNCTCEYYPKTSSLDEKCACGFSIGRSLFINYLEKQIKFEYENLITKKKLKYNPYIELGRYLIILHKLFPKHFGKLFDSKNYMHLKLNHITNSQANYKKFCHASLTGLAELYQINKDIVEKSYIDGLMKHIRDKVLNIFQKEGYN